MLDFFISLKFPMMSRIKYESSVPDCESPTPCSQCPYLVPIPNNRLLSLKRQRHCQPPLNTLSYSTQCVFVAPCSC